jgi:hypothetical protein
MGGALTDLTRQLYASPLNIYDGIRPWDVESKEPGALRIEMAYVFEDTQVDAFPAIFVDVGDYTVDASVASDHFNLETGESDRGRVVSTTVVWHHLAKDPFQAANHAACTYDLLDAFSSEIQEGLCLRDFAVASLGKPSLRKDKPASWNSQVVVKMSFGEGGSVQRESPKLKQVTVRLVVEGPLPLTQEYNMVR